MSNYVKETLSDIILARINSKKYLKKSILIIGAGNMAREYIVALQKMNIEDITVIGKNKKNVEILESKFNVNGYYGGVKNNIKNVEKKDLVIIATPISTLYDISKEVILSSQDNILIEKPVSFNYKEILELEKIGKKKRIRVAFNRLVYPNIQKCSELVKNEGGIRSARFTFTEWVHTIKFLEKKEIYQKWGIANSIHVISIVCKMIGRPKENVSIQHGSLKWHKSGSIFVGSGISEKNIPFSYHADWESSGRWGVEVFTKENCYRLSPLEELEFCKKGSTEWKKIHIKNQFTGVKMGFIEEIFLMLEKKIERTNPLPILKETAEIIKISNQIFGYKQ